MKELEKDAAKKGYKYRRDKKNDIKEYDQMQKAYSPYITKSMLQMVQHPYNTQVNEALNKAVTALAPKGNVLSCSDSLRGRVHVVVGRRNMSVDTTWTGKLSRKPSSNNQASSLPNKQQPS